MQAFLWRHLMPAQELMARVYNPSYTPPATRVRPPIPEAMKPKPKPGAKPKYNERQVANLLRQIERLYQEWYLTDDFTNREIAKVWEGFNPGEEGAVKEAIVAQLEKSV